MYSISTAQFHGEGIRAYRKATEGRLSRRGLNCHTSVTMSTSATEIDNIKYRISSNLYKIRGNHSETRKLLPFWSTKYIIIYIQGDLWGMVSILEGDSIGHCENEVRMKLGLSLNDYWERTLWFSRPDSVRFLFVGLDEERSLQKKVGHTRRITRSHFGCWCLHIETLRSTQTNSTRSSQMIYKAQWVWRCDFWKFVSCNNSVISV